MSGGISTDNVQVQKAAPEAKAAMPEPVAKEPETPNDAPYKRGQTSDCRYSWDCRNLRWAYNARFNDGSKNDDTETRLQWWQNLRVNAQFMIGPVRKASKDLWWSWYKKER